MGGGRGGVSQEGPEVFVPVGSSVAGSVRFRAVLLTKNKLLP